jgi:hypothetical protein
MRLVKVVTQEQHDADEVGLPVDGVLADDPQIVFWPGGRDAHVQHFYIRLRGIGEPLDARHEIRCARHHAEQEGIADDRHAADAFRFDARTVDVVEPERIRRAVADAQRAAHAEADIAIVDERR